ncbi:hypothetical protein MTO96_036490 [Rhipicephalus appendiculatus]
MASVDVDRLCFRLSSMQADQLYCLDDDSKPFLRVCDRWATRLHWPSKQFKATTKPDLTTRNQDYYADRRREHCYELHCYTKWFYIEECGAASG